MTTLTETALPCRDQRGQGEYPDEVCAFARVESGPMKTPIERFGKWLHRKAHGVPAAESTRCSYCGDRLPGGEGLRVGHRPYCDEDCQAEHATVQPDTLAA